MSFFRKAPPSPLRAVTLDIADPALHDLVAVLLHQWGVEPFPSRRETLRILAAADSSGLTLRPSGQDEEHLPFPTPLEALWLTLQRHLFDLPRLHFRTAVNLQGSLKTTAGDAGDLHTLSLSDEGVRFACYLKLERGMEVSVAFPLDAVGVCLKGKVIYCVETRGSGRMITGVAFHAGDPQERQRLRSFLVAETLLRARSDMDRERFDTALNYLDLEPEVLGRLGRPTR